MDKQIRAGLDLIAFCEGTSTSPLTRNNGYDVIVTGLNEKGEIFTDYSDHPFANGRPGKIFNKAGQRSTASGRYQQLFKYWPTYKKLLKLPDFSPDSQDALAIQLIREQRAYNVLLAGDIEAFCDKCCDIWASLPGSMYGQPTRKLETLKTKFKEFGGILHV